MRRDKAYLKHILDAISNIEKFMLGVSKEMFLENVEKQYAVLRGLEIVGEATKNLSEELKKKTSKHSMERNRRNERQTDPPVFWRKPRPSLGNNKNKTTRT